MQLLIAFAVLIAHVAAHGVVTSPPPRVLGSDALAACGAGTVNSLNANIFEPIEYGIRDADSNFNPTACDLSFCRGALFSDNTENISVFTPGSVVPFTVNLKVRHTGPANVSIVDVASKQVIGDPLFVWPVYADNSITNPALYPANETSFSVTIPEDIPETCGTAGACAIQWWWFGSAVKQTYISCVDFTTA